MKSTAGILLAAVLAAGSSSCVKASAEIEFDFSAEDVSEVEFYRYVVPADAEMKLIDGRDDIKNIMDRLAGLDVSAYKDLEPAAGGGACSFRFKLQNESDYEIIYVEYPDGWGRIMSSYVFNYATEEDIESCWDDFDYEAVSVPESDLPVYEE